MNRRQLLQTLSAVPLALCCGRLMAASAQAPRFLLVFLRGGYDSSNLLVPVTSDFYYESRPTIAIPRPGSEPLGALPLDSDWGLHPVLGETMLPLFRAGQLAFLPFAGNDDLSRSHFETQDSMESGQALSGARHYQSGFLNRLAMLLRGREAMSFTDQLPLIFQGARQIPNMALREIGKPGLDPRQSRIIADMYRSTPLAGPVLAGFAVRDEVARDMSAEMAAASRNAVSARGFELEARRIAALMRERYSLGFVDIGGWDTHVGEGGASGYLAGRLDELGRGLAAYAEAMGPVWRDTVVVVVSEFGRTFRENGDRGTDHGHGSCYWILGGRLKGARIAGEQTRVAAANLLQNRDYPVLNDYRALLGGIFSRLYELSPSQLDSVFPGAKAQDLALL
ncbi:DUF1501 domain-containing protein [Paludibacterium yongneupense]|uniref:DUF1501 domain-containing protein n=1 Tax=Paludibacterium yongneupense TaxID=400061 RepID=UPI00048CCBF0|nr:DUF1501 domain-containing protein [Paludibacterium yongneupense]